MFGKSLLLDMYDCKYGVCDNMEVHYRFLERLVIEIDMTPMSPPHVIHAPSSFIVNEDDGTLIRVETFADKAGISAWQALVESGIQIHSIEPTRFSSLDLYTCGELDVDKILSITKECFEYDSFDLQIIDRGIHYN